MKNIYSLSMYAIFILIFANEFFDFPKGMFTLSSSVVIIFFLVSSLSLSRGFQLYISLTSLTIGIY